MIDEAQLLSILADCESVVLPGDDDQRPLVVDSYSTTWIQHLLEERHGVVVNLIGETSTVDSVDDLLALINELAEVSAT